MAKEILNPNTVAAPTLFIGVGGTGSRIVKRVNEMCRPEEKENVTFACLDTNANDLGAVAINKEIYFVQTSSTQTVGDYLSYDSDALNNWFPKNAVIYDKTVSEGAGQMRAISRLALNSTIKTGKIKPLYDAIDDLFRKDGKALKQAMRVVLVSTASGGTGSGIALPLAMLVRDYVNDKYPNTSLIVRALILLPETLDSVIDSTAERRSQRRNAYATIKEINAFMMKGSGFFDAEEDLKRYKGLHIDVSVAGSDEAKSLSLLPFDFCFLLDGQNAEDNTLITKEQYEEQAAYALYEQNIGPMQKGAFSVEDNIIKEMSNPGNFGRNRFGGIGASTLRYPYEDIADYVAMSWALDAIGGEGEAAKWTKYDNAYQIKRQDAEKKDLPESERPQRGQVYVDTVNNGSDKFSKDLRSKYLSGAAERVDQYLGSLLNEMKAIVTNNGTIRASMEATNDASDKLDPEKPGKSPQRKNKLRTFENAVRDHAYKAAANAAEGLFINETKTINQKNPFTLEALIRNSYDEIAHPNAVRYLLYMVRDRMREGVDAATARINNEIMPILESFAPTARDTKTFDVDTRKTSKNVVEKNLDDLCKLDKKDTPKVDLEAVYEKLNKLFPEYHTAINDYLDAVIELETYKFGNAYVDELCQMFEKFYSTFKDKVASLLRQQDDLADSLKFKTGDSVMNICSSRTHLDELCLSTKKARENSSMLSSDLNGIIFDAVKANVVFEREIRNSDMVENDRRVDIFDDILLGYFKDSVRRDCPSIDLNIIQAIAEEMRLTARAQMRKDQVNGEPIVDKVQDSDSVGYILDVLARGQRLAAPGIQRQRHVEPREIVLCAYNKSLLNMRNFRVKDMLPKGVAVDTVSRYEVRFFNALYNLTPDKLDKFASFTASETHTKNAGLYHSAYVDYGRLIGPDSTKGSAISTHIDKRWDSIAVMPELDFGYQERQIMRIHQAWIYGLLYGAISYRNMSRIADKKIYKYENSEERYQDLTVSNGTPCDEFFEILDALYVSPATVEDLYLVRAKKTERDSRRKSNYATTQFAKHVAEFKIGCNHDGKASLFEIPLTYYNTLPNSLRYTSELTALVDAVIKTFSDELYAYESASDAQIMLCRTLVEQFHLMMDNYEAHASLKANIEPNENPVLDIIFRRLRKLIESTPAPSDFDTMVEDMRNRIR